MAKTCEPDELDYDVEAVRYPDDEPDEVTVQLMVLLGQVLHRRRQLANRPAPDPTHPQIGRYRELAHTVEGLVDCAGYPFPDYRAKLVSIAALALDALAAFDNSATQADCASQAD